MAVLILQDEPECDERLDVATRPDDLDDDVKRWGDLGGSATRL